MLTKLLTVAQAADVLAISKSLVYQMIERGDLPAVRFGTAIRLDPEALEARIRAMAGARLDG